MLRATVKTGIASILLCAAFLTGSGPAAMAQPAPKDDPWPDLVVNVFDSRNMVEDESVIALDAPYRAEDAAIVPLTIRINPGTGRPIRTVTLVIDENPSPVAAVFTIGAKAGIREITTRVRVNAYSNIHAVAEMSDGTLYMTKKFVKASGGCSAPAAKNPDEALASLGKMRLRQFTPAQGQVAALREAQLMIRHPNNSGLQMDQLTHLYIPAHFVNDVKVWQGDDLVLQVEGGISISEDPNFRFTFRPNDAGQFRVEAVDTDGKVFDGQWPIERTGS